MPGGVATCRGGPHYLELAVLTPEREIVAFQTAESGLFATRDAS